MLLFEVGGVGAYLLSIKRGLRGGLLFGGEDLSDEDDILFSDNFNDRVCNFRNLYPLQVANFIQDNMGISCKYAVGS